MTKLPERFWSKVNKHGPKGFHSQTGVCLGKCWIWTAARTSGGYGQSGHDGKTTVVHRLTYEELHGPLKEGLELDHLCRNRACCNPDHVEAVTHSENVRRGLAPLRSGIRERSKTHCPRGHEYNEQNTLVAMQRAGKHAVRTCRICHRDRERARRAKSRSAIA